MTRERPNIILATLHGLARPPTQDNLASTRGQVLLAGAIVAVTLAVYLPVLRGGFIWDDVPLLSENRVIKAPSGLRLIWLTREMPEYLPLTFTMHWVEWRLWSGRAAGFHVVNALLHAACAVLLWRVLRRLKVPGAWLGGLLFAVHPVAVASAAWISEGKNTLSLALALLSLLAYFTYEDRGERRWYALAVLAFLLALLAKTSVVMLPVVLLLCVGWRRGAIRWRDVLRSAPFFALSLVLGLVTVWFQHRATGNVVVHPEGPLSRLAASGWVGWFYLFKALVPADLCALYPYWKVNGSGFLAFVPLLLLAGGLVLLWRRRRSWGRAPLFALGCFLALLLPVLGFLDMSFMRFSLVADHLQYAAIAAVVGFVGAVLARWAGGAGGARRAGAVAAVACVAVLGGLACRRAWVYADEERLWRDNIAKDPASWAAYDNHGRVCLGTGRLDEAIRDFGTAIRLNPDCADAYCNRGDARVAADPRGAIEDYTEAIRLDSDMAEAWNGRAYAYICSGLFELAIRDCDTAIRRRPRFAEAYNYRSVAYSRLNRHDLALRDCDKAIELDPGFVAAYQNRAVMYYNMKEYDKAAADVKALEKLGGQADPGFLKDLARARGAAE